MRCEMSVSVNQWIQNTSRTCRRYIGRASGKSDMTPISTLEVSSASIFSHVAYGLHLDPFIPSSKQPSCPKHKKEYEQTREVRKPTLTIPHLLCIRPPTSSASGTFSLSNISAPAYDWSTCARCSGPRCRTLYTGISCQSEGPRRTRWSKARTRDAPVLFVFVFLPKKGMVDFVSSFVSSFGPVGRLYGQAHSKR